MAIRLSVAARNAAANAIAALVDAGAGPGVIQIRTGPVPTNIGDADTGTLLGTATFSDPSFINAVNGQVVASPLTSDTSADATGTAGHFRVKDSNGVVVMDGTCGQGSGDMSFDNASIVSTGTIAVSGFNFSVP